MRQFKPFLITIIAALVAIIPFAKGIISSDRVLAFGDHSLLYIPGKFIWWQEMRQNWQIPLWNYFWNGGMPFWEDPSIGALYPLNFILLWFSKENFLQGYTFFIASHFFLLFYGFFFLFSYLGLEFFAAILFSIVITWSGPILSTNTVLLVLGAEVGIVWFLYFWIRYLKEKKISFLFISSFFLAWPILAGDPEFSFVGYFIAMVIFLYFQNRRYLDLLLLLGLFLLCSAIQIIPSFAMVRESIRSFDQLSLQEIERWSLHPKRVLEIIFPFYFGNVGLEPTPALSTMIRAPGRNPFPFLFSIYFGVLFFYACMFSFFLQVKGKQWRRLLVFLFLLLGALFVVLGEFSPIPAYRFLVDYLPLWKSFRYPERIFFFYFLILLFFSLPAWRRWKEISMRQVLIAYTVLGVVAVCCLLLNLENSIVQRAVLPVLFLHTLFLSITILYFYKTIHQKVFCILVVAIALVDLGMFANRIIPFIHKSFLESSSYEWAKSFPLEQDTNRNGSSRRFFSQISWNQIPDYQNSNLNFANQGTLYYWDNLLPNTATLFGLESINVYHTVAAKERLEMVQAFQGKREKLMDLMGVSFVMKRNAQGKQYFQKRENALPYLFLASGLQQFDSRENELNYLKEVNIPSEKLATLVRKKDSLASKTGTNFKITVLEKNAALLRIELEAMEDIPKAFLVWNETYNSNWKVIPRSLTLEKVNAWAMGIFIPAMAKGNSITVEFRYENPMVFWGKMFSMVWFCLFAVVFVSKIARTKIFWKSTV